jgi:hypothetical protein
MDIKFDVTKTWRDVDIALREFKNWRSCFTHCLLDIPPEERDI